MSLDMGCAGCVKGGVLARISHESSFRGEDIGFIVEVDRKYI